MVKAKEKHIQKNIFQSNRDQHDRTQFIESKAEELLILKIIILCR